MKNYTKKYSLSADTRGPACEVSVGGFSVHTDLPRVSGGGGTAAQPVELLVASLLGCKTATAHYVARHLWPRGANTIAALRFEEVEAVRDERGALSLPIDEPPPTPAALRSVSGRARVRPASPASVDAEAVAALGRIVEERCPVAATLAAAGVRLEIEWLLDEPSERGA